MVARYTSGVRRRVLVAETTLHISYKLLNHHYPLNIIKALLIHSIKVILPQSASHI